VSPAVVAAVAVAADAIVRPTQVAELTAYQAGEPYIEVTEAGPALEKLQELLRALGETVELPEPNGTGGRQYGWYGPLTGAAVQKYQRAGGLPVTGQVTPELWRYMRSLPR
jgi:peptidoglycan hydrolase-like protein with peptidoglycan-binding domain